jgi:hypothetical protein
MPEATLPSWPPPCTTHSSAGRPLHLFSPAAPSRCRLLPEHARCACGSTAPLEKNNDERRLGPLCAPFLLPVLLVHPPAHRLPSPPIYLECLPSPRIPPHALAEAGQRSHQMKLHSTVSHPTDPGALPAVGSPRPSLSSSIPVESDFAGRRAVPPLPSARPFIAAESLKPLPRLE